MNILILLGLSPVRQELLPLLLAEHDWEKGLRSVTIIRFSLRIFLGDSWNEYRLNSVVSFPKGSWKS